MNHFNTNRFTTSLLKSQPAFRSIRTRISPWFKSVLLVIALCSNCFMTQIANAQAPTLEWVKSMGGSSYDAGRSIAVDASGNVYTTGYFDGTVDFNPGPGVFNLTAIGASDVFISKLDAAGNFMWAKSLNYGSISSEDLSVAVDGGGNVYTAGLYFGTKDFDPGPGIFNLTSTGYGDIYILKLNAAGNFMWAKTIGGAGDEILYELKIDAFDNVITVGTFVGTVDFNPNAGIFNLTSSSVSNTFISKLDAAGNFIWAKGLIGTDLNSATSVALDAANNIYTTGNFAATVDFDPNSGVFNLTSNGSSDIFISKLDAVGNFVWAKRIGGSGTDDGKSIGVDDLGNVYTTGFFYGIVDFNPGPGVFNLTAINPYNAFISKLDAAGNFVWAKSIDGEIRIQELAMDDLNNLYCTGHFGGTVDFNPNAGIFNLVSAGSYDIFILKLDALGNFVWAKSMGGVGTQNGFSIAVDAAKNVYTAGRFYITADFDPDAGVTNITSNGSADIFVHKMSCLSPPAPANTTASSSTTICYGATTTLSVSAAGTAGWYSAATGGTYLGGGNSFTTPELLATTTFYVQDSTCSPSATRTPITVTVRPIFLSGSTSASPSAICLEESTNLTYTAPSCYSNPNFEYTYAPANWILNQSPANANGSVNTTNAPSSITMVSSNGAIGGGSGTTSYSITIPCSGFVSFNWAYSTADGAGFDYPRFSINGGTPNLFTGFSTSGATTQTGSMSLLMLAGQTLTLQSYSVDNQFGACTTVISNFSAPAIPNQTSQWYTAANGGSFLGSGLNFTYTPIAVGNNTYYAAVVDINTSCVNPIRVPVDVWVNPLPKAGIATATLSSPCIGANVNLNYTPPTCESSLGFQHPNAPTNWTLTQSPIFANGTVNVTNVPSSITMTSSNAAIGGGPGTTSYSIVMPCSGFVSFNWNYSTIDGAAYDYPQYRINSGAPVLLTGYNTAGGISQSGSVSVGVTTGQTFTLQSYSVDNQVGACTTVISNFSAPGIPNQSIKWFDVSSGGIHIGSANTLSITPAITGTLTYYAEVKDANTGCTNPTREPTNSVTISALPSVNTSASINPICLGSTTTLTASGASSYLWYPGGLGGASVVVAPTATTTYTVTGIDASGCSQTATMTIVVNPSPNVTLSASDSTICLNDVTTLTASGADSYIWYPGGLGGASVVVAPTTTTTYTVIGVDANGCSKSSTLLITVNPLPPLTVNATSVICTGSPFTFIASGATTYLWNPGAVSGAVFTFLQTVTAASYTVTGTDGNGCTKTYEVNVSIAPFDTLSISASNSVICNGASTGLSVNSTSGPAATYSWQPGALSGTSITVSPLTTTTFTVTGTNANGCTATATRTITVNPLPNVGTTITNATICAGSSTSIIGTNANTYTWNPGALSGSTITVSPLTTTTYTVTGTNANGCTATAARTITVNPLPWVGTTFTNNIICAGSTTSITANNANFYTWNPGALSGSTIYVSPLTTTTYTVTGTNGNGCTATSARTIAVNELPIVGTTVTNPTICAGSSTSITGIGAITYTWNSGALSGITITVSPLTTTTYTVTGTNANSCSATSTRTITVNPLPSVGTTITSDTICAGSSTTITGTNADTYSWNPGALSGTTITVSPLTTTMYTVTGTNTSTGCTNTSTRTITVNACGSVLNLTLLIEGYYQGMGTMDHVLQNQTVVGATATQTDTIQVELRNALPPHAVASSVKTILNTNGMASCNFPLSGNYYIAIKHRNGLETWSATPIAITGIVNYDFTTSANQAYGANQTEVATNVWAFYSGDINQDENADLLDAAILEASIANFDFGYFATDINGDGNVDLLDSPMLEANVNGFIYSVHP